MTAPWTNLAVLAALPALIALAAAIRGKAGLALFLLGMGLPALAEPALLRGALALLQGLALLRIIDLVRDQRLAQAPLRARLWHAFSSVDTRLLRPAPRRFDGPRGLRFLVWSTVFIGGGLLASLGGPWRWAGGVVLTYALVEALWALVGLLYALAGFVTPTLHELPLVSRSVQELWGQRWAQVIRQWLQMNVVRVWGRRHSLRTGVLLSFVVSGVGHAYVVLLAVDPGLALPMFGFFIVQGLAVLAETSLGVTRWPRPLRHAWVLGVMLATSPLFVGATLACLGL